MIKNENPYTLRTEIVEGITRYYVSFVDGQVVRRETEVSRPVYLEFLRFVKIDRSQRHWDERHREYSTLTDETLYKRALSTPKGIEETAFDSLRNEYLLTAMQQLPETQRRRFVLYHEFGLTYEQIAGMEGCTLQAVAKTVKAAGTTIKKNFEKQENQG